MINFCLKKKNENNPEMADWADLRGNALGKPT